MPPDHPAPDSLGAAAARVARDFVALGSNRVELLLVELGEERERMLRAALLAAGAAALALLAGVAFTLGIMVLLWERSPVIALAVLALLYAGAAVVLLRQMQALLTGGTLFPATHEQLRKDFAALEARWKTGDRPPGEGPRP